MENKEIPKFSFLKRIKTSIFNVEMYDIFAVEKITKALGYFVKLIIVFSLLVSIGITYKFVNMYNTTKDCIKNEIPEFTYKDGILTLQEEQGIDINNENLIVSRIIIDTTEDEAKQEELINKIKNEPLVVLFLKDRVLLNIPQQEEAALYKYEEIAKSYNVNEFTKQQLVEFVDSIQTSSLYGAFYISAAIYVFFIYIIVITSDVLILSLLGFVTSRLVRMKLKYLPIINISIYSLTLSILLNAVYIIINTITGFEIRYFQIMYNTIAYIYLVTAILMIRAEMIKQQMELAKVIEEQKKVNEELEKQKEEEKKQDNKDDEKEPEPKENENDDTVPDGNSPV